MIFDRMANKYLSSNRLVPQWINNRLGKGHKDLHTLFCPKCGTEFDDTHTECPSCHYKWKIANYKEEYNISGQPYYYFIPLMALK